MKVALLTEGLYPWVMGGMQKHSYYLAKYLAQNQVEVDVCHFRAQDKANAPNPFTDAEMEFIRFIELDFPKKWRYPGHYVAELKEYSQAILEQLRSFIATYDFIYAQGLSGWALIRAKRGGLGAPPIGVNLHGLEMFQKKPGMISRFRQQPLVRAARYNILNADYAFSLGGKLKNILIDLGKESIRIIEVPIGIEETWLNPEIRQPGSPRKFIFIGRYERRKGLQELHAAIRGMSKDSPFTFEIIGPVPEQVQLRHEKVTYHGAIYEEERVRSIMQSGDVLVCPSYSEGMPTVILEAMASGMAIIATDVGAVSEQLKGNGWLLQAPEIPLIKKTLQEAIEIPDHELMAYKRRSQELIKDKFLWDQIIQHTLRSFPVSYTRR